MRHKIFHKCSNCKNIEEISVSESEALLSLFNVSEVLDRRKEALENMTTSVHRQVIGKLFGEDIYCEIKFNGRRGAYGLGREEGTNKS